MTLFILCAAKAQCDIQTGSYHHNIAFANEVMDFPDENIKKRLIEALIKLNEDDWNTIAKIADSLKEGS